MVHLTRKLDDDREIEMGIREVQPKCFTSKPGSETHRQLDLDQKTLDQQELFSGSLKHPYLKAMEGKDSSLFEKHRLPSFRVLQCNGQVRGKCSGRVDVQENECYPENKSKAL